MKGRKMRDNSHIRISHFFSLRISCYRILCSLKIFKYGNYHNFQLLLTKPVPHPKQSSKEEDRTIGVKKYNTAQNADFFASTPTIYTLIQYLHTISKDYLHDFYTLLHYYTTHYLRPIYPLDGDHLGVGGGVPGLHPHVVTPGHDVARLVHQHRPRY